MKQFSWKFLAPLFWILGASFLQRAQAQQVTILPNADSVYVCTDSLVTLTATGGSNFFWSSPDLVIPTPSAGSIRVKPPVNGAIVILTASVNGTSRSDTVRVFSVTPTLTLSAPAPDTAVCRGTPVRLQAITNTGTYGLRWQPSDGLSSTTSPSVTARPKVTTTYTAVLDIKGCEVRKNATVVVKPVQVDILVADTFELCLGSKLKIGAITSTNDTKGLRWSASDKTLSDSAKFVVEVSPKVPTTYYSTFSSGGCVIQDSVFVKVDSLPVERAIAADPKKDTYCQGETVTLKSQTFEPYLYPGIKHSWFPSKGFETPDSLWNMVISTVDSTIYYRISKNGGCIDTQGVFIPVIKPKDITIVPERPEICLGENVQLKASFAGEGEIEWSPEQNISCVKCKEPTVVPNFTTTYTIKVTERSCPSTKAVTVVVLQPPQTPISVNPTLCLGDSIALFLSNPEPGVTYRWQSPQNSSLDVNTAQLRVAPRNTTTYTLTAQRGRCPAVQVQTTVFVVQPADLTVPITQRICPGQSITLVADGTAPNGVQESFRWTWNNGQNSSLGPNLTVNNLTRTTTFNVTYTYGPNCGTITKPVVVEVDNVPSINGFSYDPPEAQTEGLPQGSTLTIRAITSPANPSGVTYTWKANGEAISGNALSVQHKPTADPTTYTLTIKTAAGCEVSATTPPIRVVPPQFDIPNAFTPDGDGNNDFFRVVYKGNIEIREFRVWNRWGQTVFNSVNPEGWDGNVGGKPAPSDVYVYKIRIVFPDGKEFNRQGDVTLIR